jgi:hypothetical protein
MTEQHVHLLALSFSVNSTRRLEELAALLGVVAGALLALGAVIPLSRRAGQLIAGFALIAAGVLAILALHYGRSA